MPPVSDNWTPVVVAAVGAISTVATLLVGKLFEHLGWKAKEGSDYKQSRIDKLETRLEAVEVAKDALLAENITMKANMAHAAERTAELERKEKEQHAQIVELQASERGKDEQIAALLQQAARHRKEIDESKRVLERQAREQIAARQEIESVCNDLAAQLEEERKRVKIEQEKSQAQIQTLKTEVETLREDNERLYALLVQHGIQHERRTQDIPVKNDRRKTDEHE